VESESPSETRRQVVTIGPSTEFQVAFYALLVSPARRARRLAIEEMRGCIWRVRSTTRTSSLVAFDLRAYEEAVELLRIEEVPSARIADASREEARFHLTYKCDGCLY